TPVSRQGCAVCVANIRCTGGEFGEFVLDLLNQNTIFLNMFAHERIKKIRFPLRKGKLNSPTTPRNSRDIRTQRSLATYPANIPLTPLCSPHTAVVSAFL